MENFDLTKFLAEGKLNEEMFDVATTEKIAQKIADAFTAEDNELDLKYIVNPDISERSFDLDVEAGPNTPDEDSLGQDIKNYLGDYAGGSFYIKDGVVYNAAMRNAPVANVTPEGEVEMISAEDSRAALGMEDDERNPGMYIDDEEWEREMGRMEENKEETKSNKMKKSELKEMIRAAMLAETSVEETLVDADQDMAEAILNALGGEAAFEAVVRAMSTGDAQTYLGAIMRDHDIEMEPAGDIPGFEGTMDALDSLSIREEEEEDVEVAVSDEEEIEMDEPADEAPAEDEGEVDVEDNAKVELSGDKKDVSDNLEAALEAARALGDEKLVDQIGNTITFFTRAHIVKEDELQDEAEEMLQESLRMKRLAGLIK